MMVSYLALNPPDICQDRAPPLFIPSFLNHPSRAHQLLVDAASLWLVLGESLHSQIVVNVVPTVENHENNPSTRAMPRNFESITTSRYV